jgi:hypothetical protein
MIKNPILHLVLPLAFLAATLGSVQAQNLKSRDLKPAHTSKRTSKASTTLDIEPTAALTNSLLDFQERTGRELLIFKLIPGEKNARMAEFTIPNGLRMTAFTNGPNNIRFAPAGPSADFAAINVSGPGAVGTMSGGTGARIDAVNGALGALRDAFAKLFGGGGGGKLKCKTAVTVTIDENGITTTQITRSCTKP